MRRKRRNIPLIILFIFGWLICTALFVFAGYCITGAIPVINIEMSYFERLLMVVSSPLDGYFNAYTPIGMIVGFILCEIIFFLIVCMMNRKPKEKAADTNEVNDYFGISDKNPDMEFLFLDKETDKKADVVPTKEQKVEKSSGKESQLEEPEIDVVLQEQTFLELFSNGYSMQQITEMMELTKYIKNLDVSLLKRMFKPTMAPEDIRKHIESFYG